MENRLHKRFEIKSYCDVECVVAHDIKIKNISLSGICLETSQHIDTRLPYDMKLVTKKREEIILKGKVAWSSLMQSVKDKNNIYPIYNIGLKFIEMNDKSNNFLEKLIERLAH